MSPLQFRNHVARLNANSWIDCRGARCGIDQMQTDHLRNAVEWVRRHAAESLHDEIRELERLTRTFTLNCFKHRLQDCRTISVDGYASEIVAPFQNMLAELKRRDQQPQFVFRAVGLRDIKMLQLNEPTIVAIATKVVELMNAKPTKKRGRPSKKKAA